MEKKRIKLIIFKTEFNLKPNFEKAIKDYSSPRALAIEKRMNKISDE